MTGEAILVSEYQSISAQLLELNRGLMSLAKEFSEFRGEVRTGIEGMHRRQDATNGRVTTLEGDKAKILVNQAAQDVLTPGLLKAIEELKMTCAGRHKRLDAVITTLRGADADVERQLAHDDGVAQGKAKLGAVIWVAVTALFVTLAWAWDHWLPKWFGGTAK